MKDSTAKEKMLKRIREALIEPSPYVIPDVDFDSPIYVQSDEPLEIQFAQEFQKIDGKFVFCENKEELVEAFTALAKQFDWKDIYCYNDDITQWFEGTDVKIKDKIWDVLEAKVAITKCESLVARLGSVLMSSKLSSARKLPAIVDTHVVVAYTSQLVPDIKDAFNAITEKYGERPPSLIYLAAGPSRTADIEKTLVMGAHGPKEIYVFLIDG
ncbi:MAG: LUD domain-containing protein [Sphingobacteriales bacterium JAD_PAG50586_3]|nr:MAG: LUD domain-containing protein [Sphingobacteriales bacterium JAD_PAG50586_3]